jgi:ABC-2 type transport system ATP-binding protein
MENELVVEGITYAYGKNNVLEHISFACKNGIVALLGNNGAGKSTLMNILTGLKKTTKGKVMLNGRDLLWTKPYPIDQVGYLPQNFDIYPNISGYDFLSYVFDMKNLPKKKKKQMITEVVEKFHLTSVIKKRVGSYSGGYKRRLGIAQAVIGNPALIIIDEPTAGLDPEQRVEFRNFLSEISKESITLISTHIIEDVELYSNKILILKDRSIQFSGTIDEMIAISKPHIFTTETDLLTSHKLKETVTVIEEKRLNSNLVEMKYIKDKNETDNSDNDKEISLENAYVYFQNR